MSDDNVERHQFERRLFINNEFIHAESGKTITIRSPVNDIPVGVVEVAGPEDVNLAVAAASAAFKGEWSTFTGLQRRNCISKLADLIEKRIPELSRSETASIGTPLMMVEHFLYPWSLGILRANAGYADKLGGESFTDDDDGFYKIVEWAPAGVCAVISTWNAGLAYFCINVGAALASGNTVIYKASEKTPFSALMIADLIPEAGFPRGVLNIVSGDGDTGALLASNMQIRVIAFTGSAPAGKKVAELAAKSNLKKTLLELGGKAPGIVFDDCNMENVLQSCGDIFLTLSGQICTASTRLLVQSTILEDFTRRIKERFEKVSAEVGCDPMMPSSKVGTLAGVQQLQHVLNGIQIGKQSGTVLTGGERKGNVGCYVQPTIFVDVKEDSKFWHEEVYGPVILIKSFETEDEAIRLGNDTEYGLSAQIFTRDIARALRVARKMEVGVATINSGSIGDLQSSFGGVKNSGLGRTGGWYGVKEFMESKAIRINMKYDA